MTSTKKFMMLVATLVAGIMVTFVIGANSYFANADTLYETAETSAVTYVEDERNPDMAGNMVQTNEQAVPYSTDSTTSGFSGSGSGTSDSPYVITTASELMSIGNLSNSMAGSGYYYFRLDKNITLSDSDINGASFITTYFQGEFNGNNRTITAPASGVWFASDSVGTVIFKNLTINHGNDGYLGLLQSSGYYSSTTAYNAGTADNEVTFSKVYSTGSYSAINNISAYACLVWGTCYFDTCISSATISISGYSGIFIGGYPYGAKVSFVTCRNTSSVSGSYVGFFNGNSPSKYQAFEIVSSFSTIGEYSQAIVSNCSNRASMYGVYTCTPFSTNYNTYNEAANTEVTEAKTFVNSGNGKMETGNVLSDTTAYLDDNNNVCFEGYTGTDTYEVSIFVSISDYEDSSKKTSYGSSYVMITTTYTGAIENIAEIYATRIVSSDEWDSEVTSDDYKYENLVTDTNKKYDSYGGHEYIIYNNTIIVNSDSLEAVESVQMGSDVGYVVCDGVPTYRIVYLEDGVTKGTAEFSASTITTKTTD